MPLGSRHEKCESDERMTEWGFNCFLENSIGMSSKQHRELMAGALTLSSYGYNRMRYCPRLQKHSKSVPLSLTRRDGHEKPLLFFVSLT